MKRPKQNHPLKRAFSSFFLIFSSFCFVSCMTTLHPSERCALIGQVQQGTQIGTRTNIGSTGDFIYSYPTTTYNPICKIPTTEEEAKTVAKLAPIAKEKDEERKTQKRIYAVGSITFGIVFALVVMSFRDSSSD